MESCKRGESSGVRPAWEVSPVENATFGQPVSQVTLKRQAVKRHHHKHNLKHRYEFLETLGKGTYGKVKKAKERSGRMVSPIYRYNSSFHPSCMQLSREFMNLIFNLPMLRFQLLCLEETFQTKVSSIKSHVCDFNISQKCVMLYSFSLSVNVLLNCMATHTFKKPLFAHGFNGCECVEGPLVCSRSYLFCTHAHAHAQAQAAKASFLLV